MIQFRRYHCAENLFEGDFILVRDFLQKLNTPTYPAGWWTQHITRPSVNTELLSKFGLWFENEQLVALACVEDSLGSCHLCVQDDKKHLLDEVIAYAKENLHNDGAFSLMVLDLDKQFQEAAAGAGLYPTQERDTESVIQIDLENLHYTLPEGFHITGMAENYDPIQFAGLMRRGFENDQKEYTPSPEDIAKIDRQFKRPFVDLELQLAVIAADGTWASFCGIWPAGDMACIEPVVTDPAYQKMGLGKAAVYEALRRAGKRGCKTAVVLTSKQFYFNIGFRPNSTSTWWKEKVSQNIDN